MAGHEQQSTISHMCCTKPSNAAAPPFDDGAVADTLMEARRTPPPLALDTGAVASWIVAVITPLAMAVETPATGAAAS